ncbi:restriction endonuclease [Staphylococcus ursi]|uniref:restriction endonuclease n=1 Tax=Staphylococcus sp. MI 10-1553 TaxID=1912064 RepID=UPI001397F2DA|nr:restriction endonuclease [Staphylococcus sp. MI 10-1553]QHW38377.1 restriction endonuclease [Staphylococcus sp. MI 10-1553]
MKIYKEKKLQNLLKKSNMKDIDRMRGLDFELYLKVLFKEIGYKAITTSGIHDYGADLILKKNNHKRVVQAKRYDYKKNVSISAIQEIFASRYYHQAYECWVVTNSFFTKSAVKLAKACNVHLKDRYQLAQWINQINLNQTPKQIVTKNIDNRHCPKCGGKMKMRKNKLGNSFVGCSNYPNCMYTESL